MTDASLNRASIPPPNRPRAARRWVWALLTACAAMAGAAGADSFQEVVQDFRRKAFDPDVVSLAGSVSEYPARPEARGLRLTVAGKRGKGAWVSVRSRVRVGGDFEITTAYEILRVEPPKSGFGSGVKLSLALDSPEKERLTLSRVARIKEGDVYLPHRGVSDPDGARKHQSKLEPTTAKSGRLRVSRAGRLVSFEVADGADGPFRRIFETEAGDQDLTSIDVMADNDGSRTDVDAIVQNLEIRGERLTGLRPPAQGFPPWLIWTSAALLGASVLTVAVRSHRLRAA